MKKPFFLFTVLFVVNFASAQPNIQWQKSLGGTLMDWANSIQPTADDGFIVAGMSLSYDGDVSGNHGLFDYWVVKLNSIGTIQWQKSLGGTDIDIASCIQQTTDGGYIVAGSSCSNDGDVTGHHGTINRRDLWVVKLSSIGNIEWQKSLGGTENDGANSIQQTTDGGYIVAGYSESNDGDVTGHHGATGIIDCWIVKLNSIGTIEWQKSLGGSSEDWAYSIQQTTDGGYIVAGHSGSNDGDVTGHHGATGVNDYWVVRLNSTGTIVWQKSLGGTDCDEATSVQQTTDGGYIIAGLSFSNDGDVTGHHGVDYNNDYWVVKLNATGIIEWQKSLGGTEFDVATSIKQTFDGGYIIAGYSYSNDGDVTGHHGTTEFDDYWLIKLNATGTIEWQKSFGGTNYDEANSILQTSDGGYMVAGGSSSNDGDVTGNHGSADFWVIKLSPVSGIEELEKNSCSLNVYPSPANNKITIKTNAICNEQLTIGKGELKIINIKGQEVKKMNVSGDNIQIDVNDLPAGIYYAKLLSEQGVGIAKFVKE